MLRYVVAETYSRAINLSLLVIFLGLCVSVLLAVRWIAGRIDRSIKARRDLARAVSDVGDRLEKIEEKLERPGPEKG